MVSAAHFFLLAFSMARRAQCVFTNCEMWNTNLTDIFRFQFPLFWISYYILQTGILQICLFYFADIDLCMSRGEWRRGQNVKYFLFSLRSDSDSNQIPLKPDQREWELTESVQSTEKVQISRYNLFKNHNIYFIFCSNIQTEIKSIFWFFPQISFS